MVRDNAGPAFGNASSFIKITADRPARQARGSHDFGGQARGSAVAGASIFVKNTADKMAD